MASVSFWSSGQNGLWLSRRSPLQLGARLHVASMASVQVDGLCLSWGMTHGDTERVVIWNCMEGGSERVRKFCWLVAYLDYWWLTWSLLEHGPS